MYTNRKVLSYSMSIILFMGGGLLLFQGMGEASGYVEEMINPYDTIAGYPALDGIFMVYVSGMSEDQRVVLRNIDTGTERKLVDFRSYAPDISGDHVVFLGREVQDQDIYQYTISSSSWIKITNGPEIEMSPRIYGENIVWYQDMRSHDLQILHYHPDTGIREISTAIDHDMYPNIHGNLVVWEYMKPGYSMIMGYDLKEDKKIDIVNISGLNCHKPDIYEDRIVYIAQGGLNDIVWLYNMTSEHTMYVSNFNHRSDWPRIDRDNVVFVSDFDDRWDVGLYDILRGAERRLTYDSSYEYYPVIWGEHVAFARDRGTLQLFHILLDYDDDGIPDIDDPSPQSDIDPIMELLQVLIMRGGAMETNLTSRLDDLENTLAGLLKENEAGIIDGINNAFMDLNHTLSHLNLSGELDAMLINFTDLYKQEPGWYETPDSFFDVWVNIVAEMEASIMLKLQNLSEGQDLTNEEISQLMDELAALEEINDIVSDLEQVGLDVQSQSENLETSDNNLRTYFIVLIIVSILYTSILIFFFVNVSRKKTVPDLDEY